MKESMKYLITTKSLLKMEDGITIPDILNLKKIDGDEEIQLNGEELFLAGSKLHDLGFRVVFKIDDFLREDFDIYEDTYSYNDFLLKLGEDVSMGIKELNVYYDRNAAIYLYTSGLMYVDIYKNKLSVLRLLENIREIVLESILERRDE